MKRLLILLMLLCFIVPLAGCSFSDKDDIQIKLSSQEREIVLNAGEKAEYYINIENKPSSFSEKNIVAVCENEAVAKITYRFILWDSELHYYIEGVSQGETFIYFKTDNIQTEKLKVTVNEPFKQETVPVVTEPVVQLAQSYQLINAISIYEGETSQRYSFSLSQFSGYGKDSIEIVTDNSSVAAIMCDFLSSEDYIYFNVMGINEGSCTIYAKTKDGALKTEAITVNVIKDQSKTTTQAETTTEVETTTETEAAASVVTTTEIQASENVVATTEATTTGATVADKNRTVYITPTGSKYHYKETCAGKNAISASLSNVQQTHEPCKKCAH